MLDQVHTVQVNSVLVVISNKVLVIISQNRVSLRPGRVQMIKEV